MFDACRHQWGVWKVIQWRGDGSGLQQRICAACGSRQTRRI